MPFIHLSIRGAQPNVTDVAHLQVAITRLMADILRKKAELTVVHVDAQADAAWSVNGLPLADGQLAWQMTAFITAGTNTVEEKASFIAHAHETLQGMLGPSLAPTYIVVQELANTDWGYDGKTQAARAQATAAP